MAQHERIELLQKFISYIETLSHCSRNAVAALLTDADYQRVISFGYNGNVKGGPNGCDKPEIGDCGCVHAEANALVKTRNENPFAIFTSVSPCTMCAKLIINSGIKEVWSNRAYRVLEPTIELFQRSQVRFVLRDLLPDHHPGNFEIHTLAGGLFTEMVNLSSEVQDIHNKALADGKVLITNAKTFLDTTITGVTTDIDELLPEALDAAVQYGLNLLPTSVQGVVKTFAESLITKNEGVAVAAIEAIYHPIVAAAVVRLNAAF